MQGTIYGEGGSVQVSSQIVYDQPAEEEEDYYPTPKNPLVLLCSSFHHSYRISADA